MIVLVGFMGAGKTTVGAALASALGKPFVDIDRLIEESEGRSISRIFEENGEEDFRTIEHETISLVLEGPDSVVALGGGAVEHHGTTDLLAKHFVVYLQISFEEALRRVGSDHLRPMLAKANLRAIYDMRLQYYESVADLVIDSNGMKPERVVDEIVSKFT